MAKVNGLNTWIRNGHADAAKEYPGTTKAVIVLRNEFEKVQAAN